MCHLCSLMLDLLSVIYLIMIQSNRDYVGKHQIIVLHVKTFNSMPQGKTSFEENMSMKNANSSCKRE